MPDKIFISHASRDDEFVKELRVALESLKLPVWVDSRNLRGGNKLAPEIELAIEEARQVIVVISSNTVNSPWVRREITKALEVERSKSTVPEYGVQASACDPGFRPCPDEFGVESSASEFGVQASACSSQSPTTTNPYESNFPHRVIPLLLPGMDPSALENWFDEEPLAIPIQLGPGGLSEALPQLLAALGERAPDDFQPASGLPATPAAELRLKLKGAKLEEIGEGKTRAIATAQLIYKGDKSANPAESREFKFTAPIGPIESDDLRWYLEEYYRWPTTIFAERAKRIEAQFPVWGRQLYDAATIAESARDLLADWRHSADGAERRFSVFVDSRLPEGLSDEDQAAANEAASALLALPWELMHDGGGFLFQGANPVRVRRSLPKEHAEKAVPSRLPIRILLVSPRPEDNRAAYIDHRVSARPLVDAVQSLGELAELTVLDPPTFTALGEELLRARKENRPYDVIHFDGHGVYDRKRGLGALCFEDPKDLDKLEHRASQLIDAQELGALVREHRIPLVFLEACQSAAEERPTASVAAKLLEAGVTSVVAMTHSVLVETSRRFVTAFYAELARGARIGTAMVAGQNALCMTTISTFTEWARVRCG